MDIESSQGCHVRRQALEQLSFCIIRPALANERVQTNAAAQVVLTLKTLWRHCTAHLVMSPLEFLRRLPALVLRPRRPGMVARRLARAAASWRTIQGSERR